MRNCCLKISSYRINVNDIIGGIKLGLRAYLRGCMGVYAYLCVRAYIHRDTYTPTNTALVYIYLQSIQDSVKRFVACISLRPSFCLKEGRNIYDI